MALHLKCRFGKLIHIMRWPFILLIVLSCFISFPIIGSALAAETVTSTLEWSAIFDGSVSNTENTRAMAVDNDGNVYVTGKSRPKVGDEYWLTVKYDKDLNEVWKASYREAGGDYPRTIAVDSDGNVFVTGSIKVSGIVSYGTVKYNAAGVQRWVRTFNQGVNSTPNSSAIYEDGDDGKTYLYVSGNRLYDYSGSYTSQDHLAIKYDTSDDAIYSDPIQIAEYDGPGSGSDKVKGLVVDADGNVYVTGIIYVSAEAGYSCATFKYNKALEQQWLSTSAVGQAAMVVDSGGNVYLTGTYNKDYLTVKLNSLGEEEWVKSYNGPWDGNYEDNARAIAVDSAGNVYVTGDSVGLGTNVDYTTIKYNSNGDPQWVKRYEGTGLGSGNSAPREYARAIAVDGSGDVYVTGSRDSSSSPPSNNKDYATIKYAAADGSELFVATYGSENTREEAYHMALYTDSTDDKVYVYVTGDANGELYSDREYDYATVKYEAADLTETKTIICDDVGSSDSRATDLAVDSSGNAYVTGVTETGNNNSNYLTAKYAPADGAVLWETSYNSAAEGEASTDISEAVVVDSSGNAYVTGSISSTSGDDCVTIKYNAETGQEEWAMIYDGEYWDSCVDIGLYVDVDDGKDYVYVAGTTSTGSGSEYLVIKYDTEDGNEEWVRFFNYVSPGSGNSASALAVDKDGNVYVAGSSGTIQNYTAYSVVMFDKNGDEEKMWFHGYGPCDTDQTREADHVAKAIAVDGSGNSYVTGWSFDGNLTDISRYYDYATIGYNSEGNEILTATYNGTGKRYYVYDSRDYANAIAVDADGNVYVTGEGGIVNGSEYHTIKYSPPPVGEELWTSTFEGEYGYNKATAIAVDGFGRIYVTGAMKTTGSYSSDYATVAYDSEGTELWVETWNGGETTSYGENIPSAISVKNGNVYVTGVSVGIGTGKDFGTVMYSQTTETTDSEPPVIDERTPGVDAANVVLTTLVTATFNEPMAESTIIGSISNFTVSAAGTGDVAGTVTYDEELNTARFSPTEDLFHNTEYKVTISAAVTDVAGNALGADDVWFFTTVAEPDITPPEIVDTATTPIDGAIDVTTSPLITVTFNEAMNRSTVTGSFTLLNTDTGSTATGTVAYDTGSWIARFDLVSPLAFGSKYEARITMGAKDLAGNGLTEDYVWVFTIGSEPDTTPPRVITDSESPGKNETRVLVTLDSVSAEFNESMNPSSISAETFTVTVRDTGIPVSYDSVNYDGGIAYFNFESDLDYDTVYKVMIAGDVTDIAGNTMGNNHEWFFLTALAPPLPPSPDPNPPVVVSVTPLNGVDRIPFHRDIWDLGILTATFNEAMDPTTVEAWGTFTLETTSNTPVAVRVEYDIAAMTARCFPLTNLSSNTTYRATISTEAKDLAGNRMTQNKVWQFSTGYDPTEPCYPELNQTIGCNNFDHFTYGTGAWVQRSYIFTTGPMGEAAHRAQVTDGEDHAHKTYADDEIESEAEAEVNSSTFTLKVRSQEKVVNGGKNDGGAFAASKVEVTGAPPGTVIPVTAVISRSFRGSGAVELQVHDFEDRGALGSVFISSGGEDYYVRRIDPFGVDAKENYIYDYGNITGSVSEFEFLYPATPNNGLFFYFAGSAGRGSNDSTSAEVSATVKLVFRPPPGVTVTLATGQTFVGDFDSDGDGVADAEDDDRDNALIATPSAAIGPGKIGVALDASSDGGKSLSQTQAFSASDPAVNQAGRPTPATRTFPHGLVSFRVNGVEPGGDVTVTLTFPENIPAGAKYYKVDANGFYEFGGAVIFGNTVTLTLTDNGNRSGGDSNGVADDGVIDDPGGIALLVKKDDPSNNTTAGTGGDGGSNGDSGGGDGGGCFIGMTTSLGR